MGILVAVVLLFFLFYFKCFLNISKTYCYNNHKTILEKFSISILFFFLMSIVYYFFFSSALKYIYCDSFLFIFALQLITLPKKGHILFLYSLAPKNFSSVRVIVVFFFFLHIRHRLKMAYIDCRL